MSSVRKLPEAIARTPKPISDHFMRINVDDMGQDEATLLNHVATRLLRLARSPAQEAGFSSAQYSAMSVMFQQPGISLTDLAKQEAVRHPTMSRLVKSLVASGLVAKTVNSADARATNLNLTEAGRDKYLHATERRIALFRMVLTRLSSSARDEIVALARELAGSASDSPTTAH